MQGQDISGSDLSIISGIVRLPDARGVFIRSMNLGRESGSGDPEGNREVGDFQADAFQGHKHFNQRIGVYKGEESPNNPHQRYVINPHPANESAGNYNAGYGKPRISNETRPRDIVLYTYIKISNN